MADSEEPAAEALEYLEADKSTSGGGEATQEPFASGENTEDQQPPASGEAAAEETSADDAAEKSPDAEAEQALADTTPEEVPGGAGAEDGGPAETLEEESPEVVQQIPSGEPDTLPASTGEAQAEAGEAAQKEPVESDDVAAGGIPPEGAVNAAEDNIGPQETGEEEAGADQAAVSLAPGDANREEELAESGPVDEGAEAALDGSLQQLSTEEEQKEPGEAVAEEEEPPLGELFLQPQPQAGDQEQELFHTANDFPLEVSAEEAAGEEEPPAPLSEPLPLPMVPEVVEEIVRAPTTPTQPPTLAGTGYMPQEVLIYAPQQPPPLVTDPPVTEAQQPVEPSVRPEPVQTVYPPGPASSHRQSIDSPTALSRSRRPSSAAPRPMSASQRLAVGSGAMAVRGRLAAATSREAVLKQEAEMASADLDIMRVEKAALESELEQEANLRRSLEDELEQVLQQLESFQQDPYKDQWREAEARLKVAYAQNAALEEQLKTLQVEAARDRAVAEVAERKREASETRRDAAERKVQEMQRLADRESLDRQHRETMRPSTAATLMMADAGGYIPGSALVDEIRSLKGALDQAQRTNAALVQAELERSGLVESPQEGMERRLRMLEHAVSSPLSSPNRRRVLGGGMGALGWDGEAGFGNGMFMGNRMGMLAGPGSPVGMGMMGSPGSPMGMQMGVMPTGQPMGNGMMLMPTSPSARMQYALQQMDSHMNGGMNGGMMRPNAGSYGNIPQQYHQYGGERFQNMMPEPETPCHQQYQAFPESSPFHNSPAPATRSDKFERSLRGSTRESYAGGQDTARPPPYSGGYGGPSVSRNTDPNQMHEEALRAARIQYHQEKMRMMDLQLQRQANPDYE